MDNLWTAIYFSGPCKAFSRPKELRIFKTTSELSCLLDQPVDTFKCKKMNIASCKFTCHHCN